MQKSRECLLLPSEVEKGLIQILHVEEEDLAKAAFVRLVGDKGLPYEITTCDRSSDFQDRMEERQIDVVIVSTRMLQEGVRDLLCRYDDVSRILITQNAAELLEFRIQGTCADDYLIKDAAFRYLEAVPQAIQKLIDRKRQIEAEKTLTRQLKDSEERFRAVFVNAGLGIMEVDPETCFLAVNDRMCDIVNRSREELLEMSVYDLTCKEDLPSTRKVNADLISGRVSQISYEKRYIRGDGKTVWVRATTSSIRSEETGAFVRGLALIEDITERKKAEEALQTVALFPDENPDPLLRVDQDGVLLYANRASHDFLEECDSKVGELAPETIRHAVLDALGTGRREIELPCAEKLYSFVVSPVVARGYANLYGRDITARKKAEEALAKATGRLNGIISSAMDGVISMDSNQKILLFNPAAARMFGIPPERAIGQHINILIPPRFHDIHPKYVSDFGHTGVSSRQMGALGSISGIRANGEEFPIEASISQVDLGGEKIFTVILRDITKRMSVEEALRQSEEKLRLAINAAELGTWDWDLVTNKLVWSNRCKEMFNLDPQNEVTYDVFLNAIHPDDRLRINQLVLQSIQQKTDYNAELRVPLADGSVRWINSRGHAFYDHEGKPVRMSGTAHDITEIVQAREALARSRIELENIVRERTAKLRETIADLEHFSYSITHDMRAPLRAMQSFSMLLQDELGVRASQQARDFLRRIEVAARRMDNLIRDSLDYTKVLRDELPLGEVDVGQLLRELIQSYPNLHPWADQIKIEFGELKVMGNIAGLTQCFSNLLSNAIKFVPAGRIPEVRVWAEEREIARQTARSRSYRVVRVWIEDNGLGIPEDSREKIFRMFHRLHGDREYTGTGIGLAIVRKAVKRMGGEVGVESEPGKGSRFWLDLRRTEPDLPAKTVNP